MRVDGDGLHLFAMRFSFFHGDPARRLGAFMRLQHALWLTRAVERGGDSYPRIPSRQVREDWEGGYRGVMSTREGKQWASAWWSRTFAMMEEADSKDGGRDGRGRWGRRRRRPG